MNNEIAALEREMAIIRLQIPVATRSNRLQLKARLRDCLQRTLQLSQQERMSIQAENAALEELLRQRQNQ